MEHNQIFEAFFSIHVVHVDRFAIEFFMLRIIAVYLHTQIVACLNPFVSSALLYHESWFVVVATATAWRFAHSFTSSVFVLLICSIWTLFCLFITKKRIDKLLYNWNSAIYDPNRVNYQNWK